MMGYFNTYLLTTVYKIAKVVGIRKTLCWATHITKFQSQWPNGVETPLPSI
jgi:hypothetical protein